MYGKSSNAIRFDLIDLEIKVNFKIALILNLKVCNSERWRTYTTHGEYR